MCLSHSGEGKETLSREREKIFQAPPDSERVEMVVKELDGTCIHGCWREGVEVKVLQDTRPTGYR